MLRALYNIKSKVCKRVAFTLAEVLITLGIIGVVAGLIFFTSPLYFHIGDTVGIRLPEVILKTILMLKE